MEETLSQLKNATFYVVLGDDGHFYAGEWRWTRELTEARIFVKLTPARIVVTRRVNQFPEEEPLHIVELAIGQARTLDEEDRIREAQERCRRQRNQQKQREAEWQLRRAELDLADAQKRLAKYKDTGE